MSQLAPDGQTLGTRQGKETGHALYRQVLSEAIWLSEFQVNFGYHRQPKLAGLSGSKSQTRTQYPAVHDLLAPGKTFLVGLLQIYSPHPTGRNQKHPNAFRGLKKKKRERKSIKGHGPFYTAIKVPA